MPKTLTIRLRDDQQPLVEQLMDVTAQKTSSKALLSAATQYPGAMDLVGEMAVRIDQLEAECELQQTRILELETILGQVLSQQYLNQGRAA